MIIFFRNTVLLILLLSNNILGFSQCENNWVVQIKGDDVSSSELSLRGIAKDKTGNVFITGSFDKYAFFDTIVLTNTDTVPNITMDFFLAKYDSSGKVLWAKKAEGSNNDEGRDITIDSVGNVYAVGYFTDSLILDTTLLISDGSVGSKQNSFIVKYDNTGKFMWGKKVASSYPVRIENIRMDAKDNVFITGHFYNSVIFNGVSFFSQNSDGYSDIFIAKYDSNGNFKWARTFGGARPQWTHDLELNNDFLFIKGGYETKIQFDSSTVFYSSDSLNTSIFFAKFDTSGNFIWAKNITSQYNLDGVNRQRGLAIDNTSNIYITQWFRYNLILDSILLSGNNLSQIFLAKYDSSGNILWAKKTYGEFGFGVGYDVLVNDKHIYISAVFGNDISFNNIDTVKGNNNQTGLIVKFKSNSGDYICAKSVNLSDTISSYSTGGGGLLFSNNAVIFGGTFLYECIFDTTVLNAGSVYDSYIWKTCLPCDSTGNPENVYETIQEQSSFTISPNPNNGNFELRILNDALMHTKPEVSIYNTIGQEVYHVLLKNTTTQLNLTALASGFYYVKFGSEVRKMVISY